jgi:hypothetical protein
VDRRWSCFYPCFHSCLGFYSYFYLCSNSSLWICSFGCKEELERRFLIKVENDVSTLPRKFRVPPAADLVAPRSVEQSKVRAAILDDSVVVVDLCQSSDETETNTETQFFETKKISTSKASVISKTSKTIKVIKLGSTDKSARSKAKQQLDDDDDDSGPGNVMAKICPTLSSTRKRRSAVDYDHVPEDEIFDRSDADDDNFQCEEIDNDDERLDKRFENDWPNLKTPSKRQKKVKR